KHNCGTSRNHYWSLINIDVKFISIGSNFAQSENIFLQKLSNIQLIRILFNRVQNADNCRN
ncbi:hypothetical protein BpHYR1_005270, partial [Brachionus plicatilis]